MHKLTDLLLNSTRVKELMASLESRSYQDRLVSLLTNQRNIHKDGRYLQSTVMLSHWFSSWEFSEILQHFRTLLLPWDNCIVCMPSSCGILKNKHWNYMDSNNTNTYLSSLPMGICNVLQLLTSYVGTLQTMNYKCKSMRTPGNSGGTKWKS